MCLNFKGIFSPLEQFEISSYNTNLITTHFVNDLNLNSFIFDKGFAVLFNATFFIWFIALFGLYIICYIWRIYYTYFISYFFIIIFIYILTTNFNLINFSDNYSFLSIENLVSQDYFNIDWSWNNELVQLCDILDEIFFIQNQSADEILDYYDRMDNAQVCLSSSDAQVCLSSSDAQVCLPTNDGIPTKCDARWDKFKARFDYTIALRILQNRFDVELLIDNTATLITIINSESFFEYITVLTSYINIYSILSCFIFIYVIVYLIFNKLLSNNKNTLIPTLYQIIGENLFKLSLNLFYSILGKNISIPEFFIKINTIFIFLVLSNIQGMIPYMSTLTSALTNTFYIALALFISILSTLFNKKGFFFFFNLFLPSGCPILLSLLIIPIELISYTFRLVSLSVRLFANMMAGHTLLKVIVGFSWIIIFLGKVALVNLFPILILMVLILLEMGVALIQSYIFTVLSCIYLRDIFEKH